MTRYRVTLRFHPGGPPVVGEWDVPGPAERTYSQWVGLHGSNPEATVELAEEGEGEARKVLKRWPHNGG
ncbi:hypothetical protein [Streptomyces sp. ODS28]|uniref:hypothetical protein n=1 Tax=Streptomyces sp. ODS28 TaxID=3136688 RepID=UPI0031E6491C